MAGQERMTIEEVVKQVMVREHGGNDALNWPHCDVLNWPHLRPIVG